MSTELRARFPLARSGLPVVLVDEPCFLELGQNIGHRTLEQPTHARLDSAVRVRDQLARLRELGDPDRWVRVAVRDRDLDLRRDLRERMQAPLELTPDGPVGLDGLGDRESNRHREPLVPTLLRELDRDPNPVPTTQRMQIVCQENSSCRNWRAYSSKNPCI